jgi:hypothetical protein
MKLSSDKIIKINAMIMEKIFMYLQFYFEGWKKVDEVTTVALPPSSQYLEVYKKQ